RSALPTPISNRNNYPRPRSTNRAPRISPRSSRDVSRTTLGESPRPRGRIITKNHLRVSTGRAIQPGSLAVDDAKNYGAVVAVLVSATDLTRQALAERAR